MTPVSVPVVIDFSAPAQNVVALSVRPLPRAYAFAYRAVLCTPTGETLVDREVELTLPGFGPHDLTYFLARELLAQPGFRLTEDLEAQLRVDNSWVPANAWLLSVDTALRAMIHEGAHNELSFVASVHRVWAVTSRRPGVEAN